jgi:hypothetical protein
MPIRSDSWMPQVAIEGRSRAEGADYGTVQQAGGIDRSPRCLENRSNRIKRRADEAFELTRDGYS